MTAVSSDLWNGKHEFMHIDNRIQLDILRHGECEGGNIFRGSSDVALRESGRLQMQNTVQILLSQGDTWDIIISSPLKRCHIFALSLADTLGINCDIDKRLREICFGDWEGREIESIWRDHPKAISAWSQDPVQHTPPNGEDLNNVHDRLEAFDRYVQKKYRGKKILLVTHGGVIRVMLTQCLGMPLTYANRFDVPYSSVSRCLYFEPLLEQSSCHVKNYNKKLLFHNALFVSAIHHDNVERETNYRFGENNSGGGADADLP